MATDSQYGEKFNPTTDNEPILRQPPAYSGNLAYPQSTVIVQQPGNLNVSGVRMWSSGICSCFEDMVSCCCFMLCPICCVCRLYSRYDECCCTACCIPHPLFALRVQHRNRHKIMGSMLNDCCSTTLCFLCAACQLKRDMDFIESTKGSLSM